MDPLQGYTAVVTAPDGWLVKYVDYLAAMQEAYKMIDDLVNRESEEQQDVVEWINTHKEYAPKPKEAVNGN
jgi:hypothetical protein